MAETFCASGAVLLKAGKNVSTAFTTGTNPVLFSTKQDAIDQLINQAESYINSVTRVNYTDTYSALNGDTKKLLEDAASSHAAMGLINYDMSQYTNNAEAQTMLNINYTRVQDAIKLLEDKKVSDFVTGS